ncbi:MAG: IS30 family transposase, partial [Clostridia bacterium]
IYKSVARTHLYYCHPYSAYERGSNENANKLIRRHIAKGDDISKYTIKQVQHIESWINNYPRKILGYRTSAEVFAEHLNSI